MIKGVDHINRFVREISYFLIRAIFIASVNIFDHEKPVEVEEKEEEKDEENKDEDKEEVKVDELQKTVQDQDDEKQK